MKINRNNQIMLLLYFIVVIFLLIQLYELYSIKKENFKDSESKINNKNINSIILSPYEEDGDTQRWFGTFIKNTDKDDLNNSLYLYETNSLTSGEWSRVSIMLLEKNKKVIITNLSFDKSKRMIAIGLYYINEKPVYNIYRKETQNLDSIWEKISSDVDIRSICHDTNNPDKIIGVSSYDGQLYSNNGDYITWVGPLNYDGDIPLCKVIFSYDNNPLMIGIGLFNNHIYQKEGSDWRTSKWKVKDNEGKGVVNSIKARDLIYINSGVLIATTKEGIKIQSGGDVSSNFIPIENNYNTGEQLDNADIFKSKLGFAIDNNDLFDTSNLNTPNKNTMKPMINEAEKSYKFKKDVLDFCSKRRFLNNKSKSTEMDEINLKQKQLNKLYTQIEEINDNMSK